MEENMLRLECLRLALAHKPGELIGEIVDDAQTMVEFIEGTLEPSASGLAALRPVASALNYGETAGLPAG